MQAGWWTLLGVVVTGAVALVINWATRKSDRARDDLRWDRERADREAEREHDARMQWREYRTSIYGNLVISFDAFNVAAVDRAHLLYSFYAAGDADTGQEFDQLNYERLEDLAVSLVAASAPVELAASQQVREAAAHMVAASGAARMSVRPGVPWEEVDTGMTFLYEAKEEFMACARRELGVDLVQTLPQVTPSPPSAPTC